MANQVDYKFFYLIAFLSVIYSSGQAGFCICFFNVEYANFIFYDSWCLIESLLVFLISFVLAIGIYKENRILILIWAVTIIITLIIFWIIALYTYINASVILHYEFILPTVFWKIFLAICSYFGFHLYRELSDMIK